MKNNHNLSGFTLLGLSLATSPFIVSILLLQVLGEILSSFGKITEEVFRSEQLPLLHLSQIKETRGEN